ncbi:MAG: RNA-directed DNA polymerase [Candidatus Hodarchaeota archaeon]
MFFVSEDELDVGFNYIKNFSESKFFPTPFEIEAIDHSWKDIKPILSKIDLDTYLISKWHKIFALKENLATRPIYVLDPLDSIYFTAIILKIAPSVEPLRIPEDEKIIFSFRYKKNKSGDPIFESDYNKFYEAIKQKSEQKYIGFADIADFYPRIYLHRLENALADIPGIEDEKRIIMKFLTNWSENTSYGIPIGIDASNYLGEISLMEVDEFLSSYQIDYARYIDDFYFFSREKEEVRKSILILSKRIHETQGLTLNGEKSYIKKSGEVLKDFKRPRAVEKKISRRIIKEVFDGNPYKEVDFDNLPADQKKLINSIDIAVSLKKALSFDSIDIRSVNFLLNLMTALRRPIFINLIIKNLANLIPASKTVYRLLNAYEDQESEQLKKIGNTILTYLTSDPNSSFITELQKIWLLELFKNSNQWDNIDLLRKLLRNERQDLALRQTILAIGEIGNRSAILDLKSMYNNVGIWCKRAIIYAMRNLPKDEMKNFYGTLQIYKAIKNEKDGTAKVNWSPKIDQTRTSCDNILLIATLLYAKEIIRK